MFSVNVWNNRLKCCHHTLTHRDCSVMSSRTSDEPLRRPDSRTCWDGDVAPRADDDWRNIDADDWRHRYRGALRRRHRRTVRPSLNWTRSGTLTSRQASKLLNGIILLICKIWNVKVKVIYLCVRYNRIHNSDTWWTTMKHACSSCSAVAGATWWMLIKLLTYAGHRPEGPRE